MTIDKSFIDSFAKSTARAAYGASLFRGKNDKIAADKAAVDEMRKSLNTINMSGVVVIGEGELDEAPMLYINEKLGTNKGEELDIAVDPLEGTNFTAKDLPNALSVIAVAKKNCLLKAPDMYMEKIAIGSGLPDNLIDLDHSVEKNIKLLSEAKNTVGPIMSFGSPNLFNAATFDQCFISFSLPKLFFPISVNIIPGHIALTVMPASPTSWAKTLVRVITAALVEA